MKQSHGCYDQQIIEHIVAKMKGVTSRDEMNSVFSHGVEVGLIQKLNPILYRCGSYLIHDILLFSANQWVPVLETLNKKAFRIFPELVTAVSVSDYCTVFLRIGGMNGKDLIPFESVRMDVNLTVKQSVYQELERLCQANLYVPWPSRGPWGWLATADHGRVVVPPCGNMVRIMKDPKEKSDILAIYHEYLFAQQQTL